MTKAALSARGACYRWKARDLVQSASLDIPAGKVTVIIGPNGAGKSTLLRLMSGELRPSAGSVFSDGEPLDTIAPWRLACRRAVMTQSVDLAFPFTVFEVVRLGTAGVGRAKSRAARERIVEDSLRAAEAFEFSDQRYANLSGGEKRRVLFARALAQLEAGRFLSETQCLLLDEPVSNLDLRHQFKLLDEVKRLADEGVAVLAVLHDLNLAARYADALVVMHKGSIAANGSTEQILNSVLLSQTFGINLHVAVSVTAPKALVLPSMWLEMG